MATNTSWRSLALALILPLYSVTVAAGDYNPHFDWHALIGQTSGTSDIDTARLVNQRINSLPRISDRANWQQDDYWSTPMELFARGSGDCEDFAISKFYLLRAHNIPASQLKLVFTRLFNPAKQSIEAHVVVLYQPPAEAEPLVLDNLRSEILPLSARPDLVPTTAFTENTIWKHTTAGWKQVNSGVTIHRWTALQNRWAQQKAPELHKGATTSL